MIYPTRRCCAKDVVLGPELLQQGRFLTVDLHAVDEENKTGQWKDRDPGATPYGMRQQQSR